MRSTSLNCFKNSNTSLNKDSGVEAPLVKATFFLPLSTFKSKSFKEEIKYESHTIDFASKNNSLVLLLFLSPIINTKSQSFGKFKTASCLLLVASHCSFENLKLGYFSFKEK